MPAGRPGPGQPRKPAGAGEDAPVVSVRLDAEHEAAVEIIRFEGKLGTRREAVLMALRYQALRMAGAERLERGAAAVAAKRGRKRT